jgi:two-component system NtrC family sensor kinase
MAKLCVIEGQTEEPEYAIAGELVLGRAPDCQVVTPGPLCSRHHARIACDDDGVYFIEDLGSSNGTLVNGERQQRAELRNGDWVGIGDYVFTFLLDDDYVPPQQAFLLEPGMPTIVNTLDIDRQIERVEVVDPAAVRRLRSHLAVVKEVGERACGTLEVPRLVDVVTHELLEVFDQAEDVYTVLFGFGENGEDLRQSANQSDAGEGRGMSQTLLAMATEKRQAVLASDAASDVRFEGAQSIVGLGLRSIMCCPLVVRGEVIGAVQVDTSRPDAPFAAHDLELLATVAGQMAVAAQNVRLHRQMVAQQRLAAVGQAVSSVAHCIKNVINGLAGGSYILELGLQKQDAERTGKGWEMVKRNTAFMSDLVKDMLAYCRKAPPRREPTDMAALANDTLMMVREMAARKGVQVSIESGDGLPPAIVDQVGVKRVLLNLLTNAVEACPEGSTVQVRLDRAGEGMIRLTVADDGPGIPPEVQARLFEPFFTTKGSSGTGLGLALVQKVVVEEHGGRVDVASEPGRGTTFDVLLPLSGNEEETALDERPAASGDDR